MIAPFSAVFIASLLGSTHCAGMCGAFVALAVSPQTASGATPPSKTALMAAYNGGRLITYTTLGAIAGIIGAAVDLGGSMVGLQRAAAIAAGAMIVAFGLIALLRHLNVPIQRAPLPKWLQRTVLRGHRAADKLPPVGRAMTVGLLTTLLPCGWLWAFVITAAGTAHPLYGALAMSAFWLGTLPIMISLGVGVQALTARLGAKLPLLTSILLVAVGLYTVVGRLASPASAMIVDPAQISGINVPDPNNPPPCPFCDGDAKHGR